MGHARRGALVVGAILVAIALLVGSAVTFLGEPPFDARLVEHAGGLRDTPLLSDALLAATYVGWGRWLVPASLAIGLLLAISGRVRAGTAVAITTLVTTMSTRMLKQWFERARPEDGIEVLASGFSMPSGHTSSSAAFAASIWLVSGSGRRARAVRILVVAFAAATALSRVVLGVHYVSDVVAGACLGTGIAYLLAALLDRRHEAEVG